MNEMAKKEKQTYPRTRKEMLRIMRAADKKDSYLKWFWRSLQSILFHAGIMELPRLYF